MGGGTGAYVDAWGEEFYIRFDTDNDERIETPNTGSQTKLIFEPHVIYSSGPDRDPTTWKDNITTWE